MVRLQAAAVLGYPTPEDIDAGTTFEDLGFDSLTAIELRNRLKNATGLALPPTLIFDHPTLDGLATHLAGPLSDTTAPVPVTQVGPHGGEPADRLAYLDQMAFLALRAAHGAKIQDLDI